MGTSNWNLVKESMEIVTEHTLVTEIYFDIDNTFFYFVFFFSLFCTVEENFVKVETIHTLLTDDN